MSQVKWLLEKNLRSKVSWVIVFVVVSLIFQTQQAADYRIYIAASRVIMDSGNPYEPMLETEPDGIITPHAQYRYAPVFGILLYPVSLLPKQLYLFLWLFLSCYLIFSTLRLLGTIPGENEIPKPQLPLIGFLSLVLTIRLWGQNLELGQTTILLVYLSLLTVHLSRKKHHWQAGLALSLAIVTKLMPVVLIAYLIYRKDFLTPVYTILFTGVLILLPGLIVGHEQNLFLIEQWYKIVTPASQEYLLETKTGIYNLSAFIYSYLTEMPDEKLTGNRNLLSLSYNTAAVLTQISRLAIITFTLCFLKSRPFTKTSDATQILWEFSYICLCFPLIFPAQNKYSFYYVLPACFYLSYYLINTYRATDRHIKSSVVISLSLYFVLVNLTSANIIGKTLYDQTQFYKVLTFGILALLISLFQAKPQLLGRESPRVKTKKPI